MLGLRSFFTYYGGKWRLAPKYPAPLHDTVIEPFCGAAGYATRYYQKKVILYDSSPIIAGIWDYLIRSSAEEIRCLPSFVDHIDDHRICQEAKWLIGFWLQPATFYPCKITSKYMLYDTNGTRTWGPKVKERIASQVDFIRHWEIHCKQYHAAPNMAATWFIDPPYNNKAGKKYTQKMHDYRHLSHWCQTRLGQVMVCENEGARWLNFKPFADTISANGRNRKRVSKEVIWTNNLGTAVPKLEQGSPDETGYVGPKKLVSVDGKPIDPAICQV
jgi:site-specific DNA-adenine methylase